MREGEKTMEKERDKEKYNVGKLLDDEKIVAKQSA